MKDFNVLRAVQAAGGLVAVIMMVLLVSVAATNSTHIIWGAVLLAAAGVFAGARWLDERR